MGEQPRLLGHHRVVEFQIDPGIGGFRERGARHLAGGSDERAAAAGPFDQSLVVEVTDRFAGRVATDVVGLRDLQVGREPLRELTGHEPSPQVVEHLRPERLGAVAVDCPHGATLRRGRDAWAAT